jgi:transposase-like protein
MFNTNFNSIPELIRAFPTEQSCIEYLEDLIWSGTPVSPFDPESKVYKCKDNKYKCKNTGKYFNVRTGTMYDNTKMPLYKWFLAVWLVTTHKKGISSVQLAKDVDVTQKSAWFMLQRIRACFKIENYNELDGIVEVDETFYGGKNKNRHNNKKAKKCTGRNFTDKVPIVGMIQRGGKLTAMAIENTSGKVLLPIVKKYVSSDSILIADDWVGYNGVSSHCEHRTIKDISKGYRHDYDPETHTNNIEGAWKIFKNSSRDMYNHVSRKHIQLYVDEFVYRYNMRSHIESDKFNWLQANSSVRTKYKNLVA